MLYKILLNNLSWLFRNNQSTGDEIFHHLANHPQFFGEFAQDALVVLVSIHKMVIYVMLILFKPVLVL